MGTELEMPRVYTKTVSTAGVLLGLAIFPLPCRTPRGFPCTGCTGGNSELRHAKERREVE